MERGGPSLDSGPGLNLARKQEKVVSLDNRMDSGLGLSIARQAELVFSDTAIARDAFLLKHIRRNRFCNFTKYISLMIDFQCCREGYVSLKLLISAYKPIKRLTLDWRDVALAIQTHSSSLEVNSEGTKVRRLAELPPPTEESPCCNSRTVVATTFPVSSPSIRDVVNVFSVCGDIIQVRVLRPGNPTSGGVRKYLAAHPHLQQKVCAFVEFETVEAAERAVKELPVRPGGLQVHATKVKISCDITEHVTLEAGYIFCPRCGNTWSLVKEERRRRDAATENPTRAQWLRLHNLISV